MTLRFVPADRHGGCRCPDVLRDHITGAVIHPYLACPMRSAAAPASATTTEGPYVVVAPEFPKDPAAGWGVWTRGLAINRRVAWSVEKADAERIARLLNADEATR